jgi:hypothetical protein
MRYTERWFSVNNNGGYSKTLFKTYNSIAFIGSTVLLFFTSLISLRILYVGQLLHQTLNLVSVPLDVLSLSQYHEYVITITKEAMGPFSTLFTPIIGPGIIFHSIIGIVGSVLFL